MSQTGSEEQDAAREAAQHVVDDVTAWNETSEEGTIREELDRGLDQAGVDLSDAERERLVGEIENADGRPDVSGDAAQPES